MRLNERTALSKLQDYYARHRSLPSRSAMALILGATEERLLAALARLVSQGFLRRNPDDATEYEPMRAFFGGPLAMSVPAGAASLPFDEAIDQVDWRQIEQLGVKVKNPSRTLMIRVKGDSMIDAQINSGDLAIVEVDKEAFVGDIVVAWVDGGWTLKRLVRDEAGEGFALKPENAAYPLIRPQGELKILGVMVGLVRQIDAPSADEASAA
jgi:SOS-response transcriptional repressor LexA